jgi:hypothetical protein
MQLSHRECEGSNSNKLKTSRSQVSTRSKHNQSQMSCVDSIKDFIENKLTPIKGIFCQNNYYRNNYGGGKKSQKSEAELQLSESSKSSKNADIGMKKKSVTTHNVSKFHFPLSDLLPSATVVDPRLLNQIVPV